MVDIPYMDPMGMGWEARKIREDVGKNGEVMIV